MSKKNLLLKPVLKWVGGKRQLLDAIVPLIPECSTYVEPFVGGGAVLLDLQPSKAVINDYNEELINVYLCVRDHTDELIALLKEHARLNSSDYFYSVRAYDREHNYAGFGFEEQSRLKKECDKLASRGIHFLQSNSDCPEIRSLYADYEILTVKAKRSINSMANRRGEVNEVLIRG